MDHPSGIESCISMYGHVARMARELKIERINTRAIDACKKKKKIINWKFRADLAKFMSIKLLYESPTYGSVI